MTQPHKVSSNGVDALVESVLESVDGERTGDAVVAVLAASSRLLQGPQPWEKEVKYVQDMLDYATTLVEGVGVAN